MLLRIEVGVSSRSFATVQKSFMSELEAAFRSLAEGFQLNGPEAGGTVIPVATYHDRGMRIRIMLDTADKAVSTRIETDLNGVKLVAGLEDLVVAAGLASRNVIRENAVNLHNLKASLHTQAEHVERIWPQIKSVDGINLMRQAGAREWTIRD